jgi:allantoicase
MNESAAVAFNGLPDLASAALGGQALFATDEFFAPASNLLQPGRGVFIDGKFTEQGKWMDGWESRRRRGEGHDACLIALGVPGTIVGFDIDTNHFLGNHPSFAAVQGTLAPPGAAVETLTFTELLEPSPLRPGSQNLFAAAVFGPVSHLRLSIFPDGGVARFRAYGRVRPEWAAPDSAGLHDLAALRNGGLALACSDAFFGPMNNLLLPGRAADMGGGWETRRRRGPGHDWILIKLGARGTPQQLEVDTNHFRGNYPDRCTVEAIDAPGARIPDLLRGEGWFTVLPETRLSAHTRHLFGDALATRAPATHVRLSIFPDGGISRLRVWGTRDG